MFRWYFSNVSARLRFATKRPVYTFKALTRDILKTDERFLAALTGVSAQHIITFLQEPLTLDRFMRHLEQCEHSLPTGQSIGASVRAKKVLAQYALIRALSPDIVVETGVANGVSTLYILLAMAQNGKGHLHSIDICDNSFVPDSRKTGWMVPAWLHDRWTFHQGDVKGILPHLLQSLGTIDMFIHDSQHTYNQMLYEFITAYPHVSAGGIIIADDAHWNAAFDHFTTSYPVSSRYIRGIGVMQKPTSLLRETCSVS